MVTSDQDRAPPTGTPLDLPDDWEIGKRTIIKRGGTNRFQLARMKEEAASRRRPLIIAGLLLVLALSVVFIYAYVNTYVVPPRQTSIKVRDTIYTRGDVIDFIRFNQRITEESGEEFSIGLSPFQYLETLLRYELAYQSAPRFNISVTPEDVDDSVIDILAFSAITAGEKPSSAYQTDLEEAKRQFLNRVGLPEETWRSFVQRSLFLDKLRAVLAQDVPRVQSHVLVYRLNFPRPPDIETKRRILRSLQSGKNPEAVAIEFSLDPDVERNKGRVGWLPEGILGTIDPVLFGVNEEGTRFLPFNFPSEPYLDNETQTYNIYVVADTDETRPVSGVHFEQLTDRSLTIFMNEERQRLALAGEIFIDLNDEIYAWTVDQLQLSSQDLTPTPAIDFGGLVTQ